MLTNVVVGLVVLFAVILLAVVLASRTNTNKPVVVDNRQLERNSRMLVNLKHEGNWQQPILHKGK